jgi:hypothetical protein
MSLGFLGYLFNDHVDSLAAAENVFSSGRNEASVDDTMGEGEEGRPRLQQPQSELQDKHDDGDANVGRYASGPEMASCLPFAMEDLVDMNGLRATPPATPLVTHPRPMRRSSRSISFCIILTLVLDDSDGGGGHSRSISMPPSEAQNGHHGVSLLSMRVR